MLVYFLPIYYVSATLPPLFATADFTQLFLATSFSTSGKKALHLRKRIELTLKNSRMMVMRTVYPFPGRACGPSAARGLGLGGRPRAGVPDVGGQEWQGQGRRPAGLRVPQRADLLRRPPRVPQAGAHPLQPLRV